MSAKPKRDAQVIHPKEFGGKPIRRKITINTPLGKRNTHWVEVIHERDPREVIWESIGTVPKGVVQFSNILVAIYRPPIVEKTKGGIILTDRMSEDDAEAYYFQGKVGMIVAMGERAYVDDEHVKFHGVRNQIGDWVHFLPSDGRAEEVNEVFCRRFESERFIAGVIPHPDYIW